MRIPRAVPLPGALPARVFGRLTRGVLSIGLLAAASFNAAFAGDWVWADVPSASAPKGRSFLSAVWTGSEAIFWGGQLQDGSYLWLNSGYRYRPQTGEWKPIATKGAPIARYLHTAVWTGREMIVWGGQPVDAHELANSGGCYDPLTDAWRPTSLVNPPAGRVSHTGVWTGAELIVWGGTDTDGNALNTGGRYDPRADRWRPTTTVGTPDPRSSHAAVWTGTELWVFGGYALKCSSMWDCYNTYPTTYGRYAPVADAWVTRSALADAPSPRAGCPAVWDGHRMIVWGGYNGTSYGNRTRLASGGRFDPATETWLPTSLSQAPSARDQHAGLWTGTELLVWGGLPTTRTGGHYRPDTDSWTPGTTNNAPLNILDGKGVWTGEAMLVFTDRLYEYYQTGPYAHDGLPDDWQRRYFGEANPEAGPGADPDHDQQSNWFEYLAGTDPRDERSHLALRCEMVAGLSPRVRIGFSPMLEGRTYSLWQAAVLGGGSFARVADATPERAGDAGWFTLSAPSARTGFYRVGISLP